MTIRADVAIIAGNDIFAHLVLNRFVPALHKAGLRAALFFPTNPEIKDSVRAQNAGQRAIVDCGYAERTLWVDTVYPFLAENEGARAQIAFSPAQLAARYDLHIEKIGSPNSHDYQSKLTAIDGLKGTLSLRTLRKFTGLIEVARRKGFFLNLHPSLLPKYRGLFAPARAVAGGETEFGCTLHEVDDGLDTGAIVWKRSVALDRSQTVFLNFLSSMVPAMAELLQQLVDSVVNGAALHTVAQESGEKSIDYPDPAELARWFANGVVFYRAEEICRLMPPQFYDVSRPEGARLAATLRARMQEAFAGYEQG